jgi:hypothetical protein
VWTRPPPCCHARDLISRAFGPQIPKLGSVSRRAGREVLDASSRIGASGGHLWAQQNIVNKSPVLQNGYATARQRIKITPTVSSKALRTWKKKCPRRVSEGFGFCQRVSSPLWAEPLAILGGAFQMQSTRMRTRHTLRNVTLCGGRSNEMLRVRACAARPLKMCRARSAIELVGVNVF